jgi:hypothetical protein
MHGHQQQEGSRQAAEGDHFHCLSSPKEELSDKSMPLKKGKRGGPSCNCAPVLVNLIFAMAECEVVSMSKLLAAHAQRIDS